MNFVLRLKIMCNTIYTHSVEIRRFCLNIIGIKYNNCILRAKYLNTRV